MNTLSRLQSRFQDYLFASADGIQDDIVSTEKVSAKARLEIYENGYHYRLIDAIAATYPVILAYLGSDEFERLSRDYIKQHPSTFRSIRWFGDKLADFLLLHPDYQEMPYLSELAKVEWISALVFDAPDSEVMTFEAMQAIPPESWATMRLTPHASLYCLSFSWNVVDIWQAITYDRAVPEPVKSEQQCSWLLWRKELDNQFCSLDDSESWAINAMLQGVSFGDICEGLCQWVDESDAPMYAASLLKRWISEGLIRST